MSLLIDEDVLSEMVGDPDSPVEQQMKRLRAWLGEALRTTDAKGEPDPALIYKKAAYNMGEHAIHIGMLALKNKLRLVDLKEEYRRKKNEVYSTVAGTKHKWIPSKEGETIMVEGEPNLSEMKAKIESQEIFIEFLENMQEAIRYYARNADVLTRVHNFGTEIGKIIVAGRR